MTLSGLATPLVVPPVNLIVLAAVALALGWRRLAGVALILLLLLAVPLVPDTLTWALERGQEAGNPAAAQAIVVLGAEVIHQADGRTVPGVLTLERLRRAAELARQTGLPLLVSGGVTQFGAAPVADAMAESLRVDFNTPARWVEDHSPDTFANARDSAAILQPLMIDRVLVVTQQWHMRRALLAFRAAGLTAIPAPVLPQAAPRVWPETLLPRAAALLRSYYALHEWIGLAWYRARAAW
jgi:uncharacterized SAM-binding protein YcdF (DUF218 family)